MLRRVLLAAADSPRLRQLAVDTDVGQRVARRFVAGDVLPDALAVVRDLAASGRTASLDHLGEAVRDPTEADGARAAYHDTLDAIAAAGLPASLSVKLTHLGLEIDPAACRTRLADLAARAATVGTHVTVDMESSSWTAATVDLVADLRDAGHDNLGCAVQAYLRRTPDDLRRLAGRGASLRLCKGAYDEPPDLALQRRPEIDDAYVRLADELLEGSTFPRFATHDHRVLHRVRVAARRRGRDDDSYEVQALYGVRDAWQRRLVADGLRVRTYVPFGRQWYPYLVRRLAERPANLQFFLRALVRAGA